MVKATLELLKIVVYSPAGFRRSWSPKVFHTPDFASYMIIEITSFDLELIISQIILITITVLPSSESGLRSLLLATSSSVSMGGLACCGTVSDEVRRLE